MKTLTLSNKSGKNDAGRPSAKQQGGGFVMGLVAGLLIGLAVALGVALYITKAPNLFVNKVPQRTAEQDTAETERNRSWDPNAPLSGKAGNHGAAASGAVTAPPAAASAPAAAPAAPPVAVAPVPAAATASAPAAAPPSAKPAAKDPAAILAGGAAAAPRESFMFFVQTGAYARSDDAEQQKAKLALSGLTARITEREQAGRTVYRVRLGPFPTRDEADSLQTRLHEQAVEAQIVRVEKP